MELITTDATKQTPSQQSSDVGTCPEQLKGKSLASDKDLLDAGLNQAASLGHQAGSQTYTGL